MTRQPAGEGGGPTRHHRYRPIDRRRRAVRHHLRDAGHWFHADLRGDAQDQFVIRRSLHRRRLCQPAHPGWRQGTAGIGFSARVSLRRRDRRSHLRHLLPFHSPRQPAGHADVDGRHAAPDRRDHRAHDSWRASRVPRLVLGRDRAGRALHSARRPDVRVRAGVRVHGAPAGAPLSHQARACHAGGLASSRQQHGSAASTSRA